MQAGDFLEHVTYVSGHRYGTLKDEVERIAAGGRSPILELETQGAKEVQATAPDAVTIFVQAPSFGELERRLRERDTESAGRSASASPSPNARRRRPTTSTTWSPTTTSSGP